MMKSPDEIKKGLEICSCDEGRDKCVRCPYFDGTCRNDLNAIEKDALTLIQQFEAKVPRWISVEERLPGKHRVVLVHLRYSMIETGVHNGQEWWDDLGIANNENVTHWMPLPEPPEA